MARLIIVAAIIVAATLAVTVDAHKINTQGIVPTQRLWKDVVLADNNSLACCFLVMNDEIDWMITPTGRIIHRECIHTFENDAIIEYVVDQVSTVRYPGRHTIHINMSRQ
jgi:hypothetical protein